MLIADTKCIQLPVPVGNSMPCKNTKHTVRQSSSYFYFNPPYIPRPQPLELTAANETILLDNLDIFLKNGFEFITDEEGMYKNIFSQTYTYISCFQSSERGGFKGLPWRITSAALLLKILYI